MYSKAKLEIYWSMTKADGVEPGLRLAITSAEIIDWIVSPLQSAADNMFEIYGRTCKISLLRQGAFNQFISAKTTNGKYPDYCDAVFRLINETTGSSIFTGVLPIQNINHNYDSGIIDITLVDALHILIAQSRLRSHAFDEGMESNQWFFLNNGVNDLHTIMSTCLDDLAIGLGQYIIEDSEPLTVAGFQLYVEDMPFDLKPYQEEAVRITEAVSTWDTISDFPPADSSTLQPFVYYDAENDLFHVLMLYAWRYKDLSPAGGNYAYHYAAFYKRAVFNRTNLLLPIYVKQTSLPISFNITVFTLRLTKIIQPLGGIVNQAINDENWIRFSVAPTTAGTTTGGYTYAIGTDPVIDGFKLSVRTPIKFNNFVFKQNSTTYDSILFALLSGNAMHIRATESGLIRITPSVIREGSDIVLGYPLSDEYIINQYRVGALANPETLSRAFSPIKNGDNMGRALMRVFSSILNSLACKLSFSLPETFYEDENIGLFKTVRIDGFDYIITSISYPENGLIQIECVGAWN